MYSMNGRSSETSAAHMTPSSHQPTTHSFAGAIPASNPSISVAAAPAQSHKQQGRGSAPGYPPAQVPASTNDFHLDTFFNPVWMSGPNVFSYAQNGTVVRPETYAPESYPGYYASHPMPADQRVESANGSSSQGVARRDPKPWKNVAITEQDDEEFEMLQERMRTAGLGEHPGRLLYVHPQNQAHEQPGHIYTQPHRPYGW